MGFRYRKSINLGGGFRVNLSTKGVGYSWGVKGYRITKTADGRTRHTATLPGTGISYVTEHGSGKGKRQTASQESDNHTLGYTDIEQVSSANIAELKSDAYDDLFEQMKQMRRIRIIVVVVALLVSVVLPPLCLIAAVAAAVIFHLSKTKIIYEFDDVEQAKWNKLSAAWRAVANSQLLQEITATAKSDNKKVTAGIEKAYGTEKMTATGKLPKYLTTNIKPIVFSMKQQQIAIMPDRLLVFTKKEIAAVPYSDIKFDLSAVGFLESQKVPTDAEVVKYVWGYANKDGSADKRYSNNKQFPIMKYGKIVITSKHGLNAQFMCSNEVAADKLNQLLNTEK